MHILYSNGYVFRSSPSTKGSLQALLLKVPYLMLLLGLVGGDRSELRWRRLKFHSEAGSGRSRGPQSLFQKPFSPDEQQGNVQTGFPRSD